MGKLIENPARASAFTSVKTVISAEQFLPASDLAAAANESDENIEAW
jgi:hypothetical protein